MKIKFPLNRMQDFISASKFVTTDKSEVMTIFKYLKFQIEFDTCTITKANNSSFCQYSFDVQAEDCEFLMLEEPFVDFCNMSTQKEFTLTIKDDGISYQFNDGYYKPKFNNGIANMIEFVKIPVVESYTHFIDKSILDLFPEASNYIGTDTLKEHYMHLYLERNIMYATSGYAIYYRKLEKEFPFIGITKNETDFLAKLKFADYSKVGNFNIYKCDNIIYGFLQSNNANPINVSAMINQVKKVNYAEIKITDLINFCKSTIIFGKDKYYSCSFTIREGKAVQLMYSNLDTGKENTLDIHCSVIGEDFTFNFNPQSWLPILQCLPYDNVCLSNEGNMIGLFNKSDNNFTAILSKSK